MCAKLDSTLSLLALTAVPQQQLLLLLSLKLLLLLMMQWLVAGGVQQEKPVPVSFPSSAVLCACVRETVGIDEMFKDWVKQLHGSTGLGAGRQNIQGY